MFISIFVFELGALGEQTGRSTYEQDP